MNSRAGAGAAFRPGGPSSASGARPSGADLRSATSSTEAILSQAIQRAVRLHEQGELDKAERLYVAILAGQPRNFDALERLGVLQWQRSRPAEALRYLSAAVTVKPTDATALSNLGLAQAMSSRPEDALASFDRALALNPGLVGALNNRGNALRDLHRPEEALASFERALALQPDYAEAHNNRGVALRDLGRTGEALASFERALALKPDYVEALNNRGVALRDLRSDRGGAGELRAGARPASPTMSTRSTIAATRCAISRAPRRRWRASSGRSRSGPIHPEALN